MLGRQLAHPTGLTGTAIASLMRRANGRANRLSIEALNVTPTDAVLELGFGPGDGLLRLAKLTPRGKIFGVDHSEAMTRQAWRRCSRLVHSGHLQLIRSTFEKIPLPDHSVDKVLAVNAAYFWHDDETILREIRRVLRSSGRISIYVTDAVQMLRWQFVHPETHRLFTNNDLKDMLTRAGFAESAIDVTRHRVAPGVDGWIATAEKK